MAPPVGEQSTTENKLHKPGLRVYNDFTPTVVENLKMNIANYLEFQGYKVTAQTDKVITLTDGIVVVLNGDMARVEVSDGQGGTEIYQARNSSAGIAADVRNAYENL